MTAQGAVIPTTGSHHPALTFPAPAVSYVPLPDGDDATYITLEKMRDAVWGLIPPDYSGVNDPYNIRAAHHICARSSPGHRAQMAALFDWVCRNIAYEPHPINQQTLQDARRTLELRKGDCVSLSVLLATLLGCLGYQSQFVAQWLDGEEASHVYVEVFLPDGEVVALDAVARDKPMGWRQPKLDGGFEYTQEIF